MVLLTFPTYGVASDQFTAGLAVIGDSSAVGYFAHPEQALDRDRMWQIMRGSYPLERSVTHLKEPEMWGLSGQTELEPSRRLMRAAREYSGPFDWLLGQFKLMFDYHYHAVQEYAWPYLLARRWEIDPRNILIAAESQSSVKQASHQVARVLDATDNQIPRYVFFAFLSDDLCAPLLRLLPTSDAYVSHLERAILYMLRRGTPGEQGSTIYLPVFLNLMQIIDDQGLLDKEVLAHGSTMTCRELHGYSGEPPMSADTVAEAQMFFRLLRLPKSPAQHCPTLFGKNLDRGARVSGQEQLSALANRARAFRQGISELAEKLERAVKAMGVNVSIEVIDSPADFRMHEDHLAQDCFHLSVLGQEALASAMSQELSER